MQCVRLPLNSYKSTFTFSACYFSIKDPLHFVCSLLFKVHCNLQLLTSNSIVSGPFYRSLYCVIVFDVTIFDIICSTSVSVFVLLLSVNTVAGHRFVNKFTSGVTMLKTVHTGKSTVAGFWTHGVGQTT